MSAHDGLQFSSFWCPVFWGNLIDTVRDVLSQKIHYGVINSSLVINNGKIEPTILMATYFQQSPLVFVTTKDIQHPNDLLGKRVMGTASELKNSSLALLLNHFGINEENTIFQDHSFNADDFIEQKVDVMTVFRTNQLFELDKRNIEYNIIDPMDYGFSMSAVNLFSSLEEVIAHPDRAHNFISASNKGWAYALEHPDEAINIIYNQYSQQKSIEALQYEASVSKEMMLLGLFDIGETNKELSARAVKQLKFSGLLSPSEQLGNFVLEDVVKSDEGIQFTEAQKLYMQDKQEITMCVDPNWMPYESVKNGKYIGVASDLIAQFNDQLPIPIRLIPTKSWQESLTHIQNKDCDILSLASKTPTREKYLNFTSPYIDLPVVIATKTNAAFINEIGMIKDKKLAIVKGYSIAESLREEMPDINIIDVSSLDDGLERVESGEVFGYIGNYMGVSRAIQKKFSRSLKISSRLEQNVELGVATRNDEPLLYDIFEMLVSNIAEQDLQAAYSNWVAPQKVPSFDYRLMWKWLAAMVLLAAAYLYHYLKLKQINRTLLRLSTTDSLTGVGNRARVDELLAGYKAEIDRYETPLAIIMLDIDFFKKVNDRYGHLIGDEVLIEFVNVLNANVRVTDDVGRWGGEEFLIICPNINIEEAALLADKLLQIIRTHAFSHVGTLTASAGINDFSKDISVHMSLQNADKALYQSKDKGRNQVTVYQEN